MSKKMLIDAAHPEETRVVVLNGTRVEDFDFENVKIDANTGMVIGMSAHHAEKMKIEYPLLADFQPRGAVGAKYGVYLEDKGITGRAIFIVDRNGKLAWQKNYDIPVVPDIAEVSKALAAVK